MPSMDAAKRSDDYLRATVDGLARERSAAGDFRTNTTTAAGSRHAPGAIGARAGLMRPRSVLDMQRLKRKEA